MVIQMEISLKNFLYENVSMLNSMLGKLNASTQKNFFIGKNKQIDATIIYIEGLVNTEFISEYILKPLMIHADETFLGNSNPCEYIAKKYILASNSYVEKDVYKLVDAIKSGYTILLIDGIDEAIVSDTKGGEFRSIDEPENEASIKGNREGFIENIETNLSIIKRYLKDTNLTIERLKVGLRSKTDVALVYIDDIVDKEILQELKNRINAIEIDGLMDGGMLSQYIEDYPYSPFPQVYGTERSDKVISNILEGRIAIIINRSSYVLTVPAVFNEFFQAIDDYNQRALNGSFSRILRYFTSFLILTLPPIYLTLIKFNIELIPLKLITPIIQSRKGIYLTPFLEIVSMDLVVEFLREGGLRLPPKIGSTLSIVGGIIIGNAAVQSKLVSPITLFVIGVSTIATFLIENYEMSLSIRIIKFPILIFANFLGFLGITAAWFILLIHLSSLSSFNVQYFSISKKDLKDIFLRAHLWKMNQSPEAIPNNNPIRQRDFVNKIWRNRKNG